MKKHYALYRDGLLMIRTKTYAKAKKIMIEHMCLENASGHAYDIRPELWTPEPIVK